MNLEEYKINIKIKLAALWTSVMFCYVYGDYFQLYAPHKVENLLKGDNILDSPLKLFIASLFLAIPAVMICFSVLLRPRINRILNMVLGVFYTLVMVLIAINSFSQWYLFYVFLAVVESVLTAIIAWYAFKWPKNIATQTH